MKTPKFLKRIIWSAKMTAEMTGKILLSIGVILLLSFGTIYFSVFLSDSLADTYNGREFVFGVSIVFFSMVIVIFFCAYFSYND